MKIKICGITNVADAVLAEKLGADVLGFIFAKSPRKVSVTSVVKIAAALKSKTLKAGVFVDEKPEKVMNVIEKCRLDIVQLHGKETISGIKKIRREFPEVKIVKAVSAKDKKTVRAAILKYKKDVELFLFDTYDKKIKGGTGKQFNWELLKGVKVPFFIAGGLNPENILEAIKITKPYGVDVSSGVESKPGKKSAVKLKKLFERLEVRG